MKKLLVAPAVMFLLIAPSAQAGYFAFHADVTGHLSDVLGDYGRPPTDDDTDGCVDTADDPCDGSDDDVVVVQQSWLDWVWALFQI